MNRNRIVYLFLIILTIAIGLFSRSKYIPDALLPYIGDVLYTTMYVFIFGFLFPKWTSLKIIIFSILTCYAIEFLQLYQADWIEKIRDNYRLGGLVLGHGFLWSDLICYLIGGALGWLIDLKTSKLYTTS